MIAHRMYKTKKTFATGCANHFRLYLNNMCCPILHKNSTFAKIIQTVNLETIFRNPSRSHVPKVPIIPQKGHNFFSFFSSCSTFIKYTGKREIHRSLIFHKGKQGIFLPTLHIGSQSILH